MIYDFYRAGQINDKGPVLWMFRYWRKDGGFGSCELVEDGKLEAQIKALRDLGYTDGRWA